MGNSKKKNNKPTHPIWSSVREHDAMAQISYSMLTSQAWHDLSPKQKTLYICLRCAAYRNRDKPSPGDRSQFYFNKWCWDNEYQLYTANDRFTRDMNALISKGFVRVLFHGRNTRQKNIFQFWEGWQLYDHGTLKISPGDYLGRKQQVTAAMNDDNK